MTTGLRVMMRADAGARIGLGHLCRSTALAQALRRWGADVRFLLWSDHAASARLERVGGTVVPLRSRTDVTELVSWITRQEAHVVVVDTDALEGEQLSALRETGAFVAAIDDTADRTLPVDLIINGSVGAERLPYRTQDATVRLLGPSYALLREGFATLPARVMADRIRRLLITTGGSDFHRVMPRLVRWARAALPEAHLEIVIGPLIAARDAVEQEARAAGRATIHDDPWDLRDLMLGADLALSGGGQTTYELVATGTPAVAIRMAPNQTVTLAGLAAAGALRRIGDAQDARLQERLLSELRALDRDAAARQAMSERGRALVDGRGAERVAERLMDAALLVRR